MDGLALALERLLMGAHVSLETDHEPQAEWLAGELRKEFGEFPTRTEGVAVTVLSDKKVEIDFPGKVVRVLAVTADGQWWGLSDAVDASYPGQVANILANP